MSVSHRCSRQLPAVRFLLVGLLAHLAPAQQVFVVDAAGGGFSTQIQPAVDAAAPGDVILVRAGQYNQFNVAKGVSILGGPFVRVFGIINVRSVPPGQTLTLRGFAPATSLGSYFVVSVFGLAGADGHVHLEDIETQIPTSSVAVIDCDQVSLQNVIARGGALFLRSTVVAAQCTFVGLDAAGTLAARPGVSADGDVRLAHCVCLGGNNFLGGPPAEGLLQVGGTVRLHGGPGMTVRAGIAPQSTASRVAILGNTGTLELDPDTTLVPWNGGLPIAGQNYQVVARVAPSLTARRDPTRTQLLLRVRAPNANNMVMALGIVAQPPLLSPFGALWLDLAQPVLVVDAGGLVSGTREKVLLVRPAPPWITLVVQAVAISATGFELTNPVVVTFPGS